MTSKKVKMQLIKLNFQQKYGIITKGCNMKKNITSYKEYISSLTKDELINIVTLYNLNCSGKTKEDYIQVILDNQNQIVEHTLDLFQTDEYYNLKYLIKKKGQVTVQINNLLLAFLKVMVKNKLIVEKDNNTFIMPNDLLERFAKKLKNKNVVTKFASNTKEYTLIMGYVSVYGIIDFKRFYQEYSKDYKISFDKALDRIKQMTLFYDEFKLMEKEKNYYLVNNLLTDKKIQDQILKNKKGHAIYTNKEIKDIYNFSYFKKNKAYNKLTKYITHHYNVEKGNIKVINKYILAPYLDNQQLDENGAELVLETQLTKYFEIKNDKQKEKFKNLFKNIAKIYPSWEMKGYTKETNYE